MALIVSDQQPLTIELSVSGGQTELERSRAKGVLDDFMVMVNSASAIPYDPANVEPPLGEQSILHSTSRQACLLTDLPAGGNPPGSRPFLPGHPMPNPLFT